MDPKDVRKQVEALVEAEWQKLAAAVPTGPPEQFVVWRYAISPGFPAAWPPDGKGQLYYYAYARGFSPRRLADAELVGALWARVTVDANGCAAPHLEILTRQIKEIGIQGVRPLRAEEIAVVKSDDAVEAQLYKLSRQATHGNIDAPAIQRYFSLWCETSGTLAEQIRPYHKEFFRWLGCG